MGRTAKDPSQIEVWGIDADPKNAPTQPMKLRNDGEQEGYSWQRPQQQPLTVEVMHSNERPDVTSVFGTSTPPSGPSGEEIGDLGLMVVTEKGEIVSPEEFRGKIFRIADRDEPSGYVVRNMETTREGTTICYLRASSSQARWEERPLEG